MKTRQNTITPDTRTSEFGPLPRRGLCPVTGLSRSAIYALEKIGAVRVIRLRKPGNVMGRCLLDYASVRAYYAKLVHEQSRADKADTAANVVTEGQKGGIQ